MGTDETNKSDVMSKARAYGSKVKTRLTKAERESMLQRRSTIYCEPKLSEWNHETNAGKSCMHVNIAYNCNRLFTLTKGLESAEFYTAKIIVQEKCLEDIKNRIKDEKSKNDELVKDLDAQRNARKSVNMFTEKVEHSNQEIEKLKVEENEQKSEMQLCKLYLDLIKEAETITDPSGAEDHSQGEDDAKNTPKEKGKTDVESGESDYARAHRTQGAAAIDVEQQITKNMNNIKFTEEAPRKYKVPKKDPTRKAKELYPNSAAQVISALSIIAPLSYVVSTIIIFFILEPARMTTNYPVWLAVVACVLLLPGVTGVIQIIKWLLGSERIDWTKSETQLHGFLMIGSGIAALLFMIGAAVQPVIEYNKNLISQDELNCYRFTLCYNYYDNVGELPGNVKQKYFCRDPIEYNTFSVTNKDGTRTGSTEDTSYYSDMEHPCTENTYADYIKPEDDMAQIEKNMTKKVKVLVSMIILITVLPMTWIFSGIMLAMDKRLCSFYEDWPIVRLIERYLDERNVGEDEKLIQHLEQCRRESLSIRHGTIDDFG